MPSFWKKPPPISSSAWRAKKGGATRKKFLRFETLEDRSLLSVSPASTSAIASPELDLNGPAAGLDFAVDRVDANGLVSIVSHSLLVSAPSAQLSSATITITNTLSGDVLGVLTHDTNISQSYANGVLTLTGTDSVAHYQQVLRTARFNSTATRAVGDTVNIDFVVNDGSNDSAVAHSVVTTVEAGTATVAARHIFYNDSSFDGNDPAANAADDLAIATDKQVLPFDQTATQANYSNYSRGLNGVMIDIAGPHGKISVEDFIFQVGNNNLPDTWDETPAPLSVITRPGAGQNGSDRVEITWADGAIANEWLEVVVAANRDTGLTKPDTFYFGNAVGESGDSSSDARVNPFDALQVVNRLLGANIPAAIGDSLDFNRDQSVNAQDALVVINRLIAAPPDLQLINVASIAPAQINYTTSTLMAYGPQYYQGQLFTGTINYDGAIVATLVDAPDPGYAPAASSPAVLDPQAVAAAFAAPTPAASTKPADSTAPPSPDAALEWLDPFNADS